MIGKAFFFFLKLQINQSYGACLDLHKSFLIKGRESKLIGISESFTVSSRAPRQRQRVGVCFTESRRLLHDDKYSYGLLTKWVWK